MVSTACHSLSLPEAKAKAKHTRQSDSLRMPSLRMSSLCTKLPRRRTALILAEPRLLPTSHRYCIWSNHFSLSIVVVFPELSSSQISSHTADMVPKRREQDGESVHRASGPAQPGGQSR